MSLSFTDRENLWIQAGGDPTQAPMAAAISMAENTAGDPNIISKTNDVGLWQINLDAHPEYDLSWLQNPLNNATAAVAISKDGKDWTPWTTFKSGAYQQYLNGSPRLLSDSSSCNTSSIPMPSVAGIGGGSVCLDGPIGVGSLALGVVIALVGIVMLAVLALPSGTARGVVSMAGPIGRVASVAL